MSTKSINQYHRIVMGWSHLRAKCDAHCAVSWKSMVLVCHPLLTFVIGFCAAAVVAHLGENTQKTSYMEYSYLSFLLPLDSQKQTKKVIMQKFCKHFVK